MAGVRLDNNTASTKQSERWIYMTSKPTKNHWKLGETVAGVKLNNNTASRKQSERRKITEKLAKLWLEWNSTTTQREGNKANGDIKDVKTCRIFAINIRKRGSLHGKNSETVAGVGLRQQHSKHENRNESNRDEKYADRLEMFVQNIRDYDVLT